MFNWTWRERRNLSQQNGFTKQLYLTFREKQAYLEPYQTSTMQFLKKLFTAYGC